ncbi:unnamed protein product [Parnassius apollo]|uniref:(apollo) hypothetical protein n=1 Tax=Parnassius apollo TaxID=110799 RepID=A0A8S3WLM3_PARAO|nr:unnamed protein product [Parnassius apollo]
MPAPEIQRENRKGHEKRTIEIATYQPTGSLPQPRESTQEGCTTIIRRGSKCKEGSFNPSKRPASVRPRSPKSVAVVMTLQPGAEDRGLTCAKVLTETRKKINFGDLGISAVLTGGHWSLYFRRTRSNEKADSLG